MASVNDILKTIDDAVNKLANTAEIKQLPAYRQVVDMLQKLETRDGALVNNIKNLKTIAQIKTKILNNFEFSDSSKP